MGYREDYDLATQRVDGCDCRSKQHRQSFRKWHKRAIAFQVILAGLTAVGGSALLVGVKQGSVGAIITGGLAILAAILTAASEAVSPAKTAGSHRLAATRFSALGVAFRTFVRTSDDNDAARQQFQELEKEHLAAERLGPDPEQWDK